MFPKRSAMSFPVLKVAAMQIQWRKSAALRSGGREKGADRTIPRPPMRRMHPDRLVCRRTDPAVENTTTRKYKGMKAVMFNDGKFKIAIKWCG